MLSDSFKHDLRVRMRNFSVKFPEKPTLIKDGKVRTWRYDYTENATNCSFSISVASIRKPESEDKIYEDLGFTMGVLQENGRQIFSDDETKILGVPCYTGVFEYPNRIIVYRKVFIKDTNRYVLTYATTQPDKESFNNFVNSFHFIKN